MKVSMRRTIALAEGLLYLTERMPHNEVLPDDYTALNKVLSEIRSTVYEIGLSNGWFYE